MAISHKKILSKFSNRTNKLDKSLYELDNGKKILLRTSIEHVSGKNLRYFFGINEDTFENINQSILFVLFVCGTENQIIVMPASKLLDLLQGVLTARDNNWKINIYESHSQFEIAVTGKPRIDITEYLNNFDLLNIETDEVHLYTRPTNEQMAEEVVKPSEEPKMTAVETEVIDNSEDEVLDFTYSITSYGADYPVDSLVNRLRDDKIKVPDFQRGYVWNLKQASRFIESLLLGLPVPGIFLSRDLDSADLLVIDGQQRLKSLLFFYDGFINERVFRLRDVQERFEGKTYKELEPDDRQRLDDSIIHATIVKQDEPSEDNSSVYLVFERLNTGGLQLQPQEIRSAIYSGSFVSLLKELNEVSAWRNVYGNKSTRLKDQEFILRFFAMYLFRDNYQKPLKGFLNSYMARNRYLKLHDEKQLTKIFTNTISFVNDTLGNRAFRPIRAINASVYDSMMVGVSEMLATRDDWPKKEAFLNVYEKLLANEEYLKATTDATSDEPVVQKRMDLAIKAFSKIQ